MTCEGCKGHGEFFHRCRADEASCIDGKDCPDYVEHCDCTLCWSPDEEDNHDG